MNTSEFEFLSTLVKSKSGIVLSTDKTYLLVSRLNPVATKHGFASIDEMVSAMKGRRAGPSVENDIVEAMTTNESYFFRDRKPFDAFEKEFLPYFLDARANARQLRIWCAAASSGQEPYTLAMQLKEASHKLASWRTEILGTDISTEILEKARSGLFSQFEVQRGLPIQLLAKYFEKRGELWQIKPEIRAMVQYRKFNLLERMQALGRFDIVFCRNVLIYFDRETKADILARIAEQMAPDGVLVLGAAETVIGITSAFVPMADHRGFYQKASAAAAAEPQAVSRLTA